MKYKIREYRRKLGMTQTELSKYSNISKATISALESGKAKETTTVTIAKLAGALGCEPKELLTLDESERRVPPLKRLKRLKTIDNETHICMAFRLYGCPIWVPVAKAEELDRNLILLEKMLARSMKAVDQLREIKQLADQIDEFRFR